MQSALAIRSTAMLGKHFAGSFQTDYTTRSAHGEMSSKQQVLAPESILALSREEVSRIFAVSDSPTLAINGISYLTGGLSFEPNKSAIVIDAEWIFRATKSTDENGLTQLGAVVDGVNRLISTEQYELLDKVFVAMPSTASKHVLVALLRSTAAVRGRMPGWQPFLNRVRDALVDRGIDADRVLKGLL